MPSQAADPYLALLAVGACLAGRWLHIFSLTALANTWRAEPIPLRFQCVMAHSGLRGAIAVALAVQVYGRETCSPRLFPLHPPSSPPPHPRIPLAFPHAKPLPSLSLYPPSSPSPQPPPLPRPPHASHKLSCICPLAPFPFLPLPLYPPSPVVSPPLQRPTPPACPYARFASSRVGGHFALLPSYPPPQVEGPHAETIVAATMVTVLFTVFVLGGTTKLLLDMLNIETGVPPYAEDPSKLLPNWVEERLIDPGALALRRRKQQHHSTALARATSARAAAARGQAHPAAAGKGLDPLAGDRRGELQVPPGRLHGLVRLAQWLRLPSTTQSKYDAV